jgi:hypothetical protein
VAGDTDRSRTSWGRRDEVEWRESHRWLFFTHWPGRNRTGVIFPNHIHHNILQKHRSVIMPPGASASRTCFLSSLVVNNLTCTSPNTADSRARRSESTNVAWSIIAFFFVCHFQLLLSKSSSQASSRSTILSRAWRIESHNDQRCFPQIASAFFTHESRSSDVIPFPA